MLNSIVAMKKKIESKKYLCFFGAGTILDDCLNQIILSAGKHPDFYCDNADEKWGKIFYGKKCISPDELKRLAEDTFVIITARNHESIYNQLKAMGVQDIFASYYHRNYNALTNIKKIENVEYEEKEADNLILDVRNKWTFITGASRGVGRCIALEMAKLGSNIIAHSRSVRHVKELSKNCADQGVKFIPVEAELSNPDEVEKMLANLNRLKLPIDILFNNAGIARPYNNTLFDVSNEDYLISFHVNTLAPIKICMALIPQMMSRGFGRIIMTSSTIQKQPSALAYACSKAALDKFVCDMTTTLNNSGVDMSLLDPGWRKTDMGGSDAPLPVETVVPGALMGALLKGNINGRWFTAQDYAGMTIKSAIFKAKLKIDSYTIIANNDQ